MQVCDECGAVLSADIASDACNQCGTEVDQTIPIVARDGGQPSDRASPTTELERLPTTQSGSVKKSDAMDWLDSLGRPSSAELRQATIEKPSDFSGSTFPTDISTIRLTGSPEFIETVAGLFTWIVDMEDASRRVEINLKETEDRETGEDTGNYALYLSVAERG